jgi:dipeptidyl aminopeptidase/acylaminoacyl peptidase
MLDVAQPAQAETLVVARRLVGPSDWSPDGQLLAFTMWPDDESPRSEIWMYAFSDRAERPWLVHATASVAAARFSPDGAWVAYQSDESGRWEVYLRPFPEPGPPVRISADGGVQPVWRRDGRELYFVDSEGRVMAVPLSVGAERRPAAPPRALFNSAITPYWTLEAQMSLDASPGGERFIVARDDSASPANSITVVQNWPALLRGRR